MKYLLIENKGEIDVNAFVLMGGSTKREETDKIGFFGSGNKYAIACFIRHNIPFKIFSGNSEIVVTTKPVYLKESKFEQILINSKETSLTTAMGPKWEPWMAVREVVSNSMDEEGYNIITETEDINAVEGKTRIYIAHTPEILEIIRNWDTYFSFDRTDVLWENKEGRILENNTPDHLVMYRRGIRCYNLEVKSLFQYDLKDFAINESRIIESRYEADQLIVRFLANCKSTTVIRTILSRAYMEDTYEKHLAWYYGVSRFDPHWREVIGDATLIVGELSGWFEEEQRKSPCYIIPNEMAKILKSSFPELHIYGYDPEDESSVFKDVETTSKMEFLLKEADKFFEETKYEVKFPIEVVNFINNASVLGRAKNNTIYLSERLFTMGKRELISTIIEENEHLKTGFKDKTRELQTHLINLFISEKEERFAYFC